MLNMMMGQIEFFLYRIQNLCLRQTWLTKALAINHFDAQGRKINHTKVVMKNKINENDEAAWHEL